MNATLSEYAEMIKFLFFFEVGETLHRFYFLHLFGKDLNVGVKMHEQLKLKQRSLAAHLYK